MVRPAHGYTRLVSAVSPLRPSLVGQSFRHDVLAYRGAEGFVNRTGSFIQDSLTKDEPIMVVVSRKKIDMLRHALGDDARNVRFADMSSIGRNPARIIPAWADFVEGQAPSGRMFRGVGEPIWAGRTPDELVECERHEALLNVAFGDGPAWWLACPYDLDSLDPVIIEEAERNHPSILDREGRRQSPLYLGTRSFVEPFDTPLPPPVARVDEVNFGEGAAAGASPSDVRRFVRDSASVRGLPSERIDDLVLAASEATANSVQHGGGKGSIRVWSAPSAIVCEVVDTGRFEDPLVGRRRPGGTATSGYGVWIIHQLCDLVQIRTFADSSVVRMHMYVA
jgi:anti-sigma regulatory factor (Ser/Thr protein kinase)